MGKLSDHYDPNYTPGSGGDYLPAGKHKVRVKAYSCGSSHVKGTPFVEFEFESQEGKAYEKFYLATKESLKRLASFATACGMGGNDLAMYDPEAANDHAKLVNRVVIIDWQLQKNSDKYHEVVGWERAGEGTMIDMPKEPMQPVPNEGSEDSIPF